MDYQELKEAKNRNIKENHLEVAIKYAEKMVPLCKDMHELKDLSIELADLLFQAGNLERAGLLYNEFCKLYPGYDKIEHAYHRAILCSFYGMLDAVRDQTKTKETLELTKNFLERSDVFTQFSTEVADLQKQCYQRLIDSEISISDYYLKRGNFKAAQNRIDGLRKEFLTSVSDLEPRLLVCEINLAEKQNNPILLVQKRTELEEKFPAFLEPIVIAQSAKKVDFTQKF